jgi:hypothetical protein
MSMKPQKLALELFDGRKAAADKLSRQPFGVICVKQYSVHPMLGDMPIITPNCSSIVELEEQIDRLIDDLELIREEARVKFKQFKV